MPQNPEATLESQATLDPRDWDEFKRLAFRMVEETVDHLTTLRDRPAWQQIPEEASLRILEEPLPRQPQGDVKAYEDFVRDVQPYPNGNLHPGFLGWVQGTGTPLAAMADMLASSLNPHLAGCNQAPVLVEKKVIEWLVDLMGFPKGTSGVLESGGTMANVLGLAVARHAKAGFDMRKEGLQSGHPALTLYCSAETHGWVQKGAELLGLGSNWVRKIAVDAEYRIKITELKAAIEEDERAGYHPFCVIGTAGTVNTGATDDLNALADLCQAKNLWFHIDGAFGAIVKLSPKLAPIAAGLERADSVAFDLHKWMYLPFEIACLLVRNDAAHTATFAFAPSYIAELERGVIAGGLPFSDRGIDLTRNFKALKAWMCMKSYGIDAFAQLIEQNVAHMQHLAQRVRSEPHLELLAPAPLNVVCFRYNPGGLSEERLNALNLEILLQIQERGIAVPSSTMLNGAFALRACEVNHRTRLEDIDVLADAVLRMGAELTT